MEMNTDHIPDASKMIPTPEDYANDIERIIQEEEREPNELFERQLVMSVLRRAQAAEGVILDLVRAWSTDPHESGLIDRLEVARSDAKRIAARIREGREKGVRV
jgi:hypothetical protein